MKADGLEGAGRRSISLSRARFQTIYRTLRERICLLDYAPGQTLGEAELAAEFGTSRTPVRSVLSRLEAEGLVERRHGVGTIVTDVDIDALKQVYALRIELAALMGKLAPLQAGLAPMRELENCRERCLALGKSPDPCAFARLNMDFHTILHGMIGNGPLGETLERLYFQTARIWLKSVPLLTLSFEVEMFARQIGDVIEALSIGDHVSVGDICRVHVAMSFHRLARYAPGHAGIE
jgi:DNA-binding GntR family transcriptional regulator